MKLYTYDPAPSPRRLALFMQYKGIEIDSQQVDMMQGEQLGEAYRAVVPACTVPALVLDDGTVLTEVIGACAYLDAQFPDKPLFGTTPLEKGMVLSWVHRLFNTVFLSIAEILRNGNPNFADRALPGPLDLAQIPELVERGRQKLEHAWTSFEEAVPDTGWLAGDTFSMADIDMVVCAEFSGWVKSTPPESCTRLHAYLARARAELGLA